MYNEQLEKLIELSLFDGEITSKEKEVLLRKASALGIEKDEFEVVLEAKLLKRKAELSPDNPESSKKHGSTKKCPACGSLVVGLKAVCVDCGYDFKDITANQILKNIEVQFRQIEIESDEEYNKNVLALPEKPKGLKWLFGRERYYIDLDATTGTNNNLRSKLDLKVEERKCSIILNTAVPNTREDILAFLTAAVPQGKDRKAGKSKLGRIFTFESALEKAWRNKAEQLIHKARISLAEDKATMREIDKLENELHGNI